MSPRTRNMQFTEDISACPRSLHANQEKRQVTSKSFFGDACLSAIYISRDLLQLEIIRLTDGSTSSGTLRQRVWRAANRFIRPDSISVRCSLLCGLPWR